MKIQLFENLSLPDVLKSKRFWTALIGIAAMLVTPENASLEVLERVAEVREAILLIVMTLVVGYSAQDAASAFHGQNKYISSDAKDSPSA